MRLAKQKLQRVCLRRRIYSRVVPDTQVPRDLIHSRLSNLCSGDHSLSLHPTIGICVGTPDAAAKRAAMLRKRTNTHASVPPVAHDARALTALVALLQSNDHSAVIQVCVNTYIFAYIHACVSVYKYVYQTQNMRCHGFVV